MLDAPISEALLRQVPGCAWLLNRTGAFMAVYGDTRGLFGGNSDELPGCQFTSLFALPARSGWDHRIERVLTGEIISAATRFTDAGPDYSITLFPVILTAGEPPYVGGRAFEVSETDSARETLEALESERFRLALRLHDHVGQDLSAIGLQLDLLRMDLGEQPGAIRERMAAVQSMLDRVMTVVRDVSRELNPVGAERAGLRVALDALAGRLRTQFKGTVRVLADQAAQPPPETAAALYRIAQDAATRAMRAPGCSTIEILLKSIRNGLSLEIRDNGEPDSAELLTQSRTAGTLTMERYAEQAGIHLQIDRLGGQGTIVRAFYPSASKATIGG